LSRCSGRKLGLDSDKNKRPALETQQPVRCAITFIDLRTGEPLLLATHGHPAMPLEVQDPKLSVRYPLALKGKVIGGKISPIRRISPLFYQMK